MNVTFCDEADMGLNTLMSWIILVITCVIVTANIIHLIFLSTSRQHEGTVFYRSVRIVTCLDITTLVLGTLGTVRVWRDSIELSYHVVLFSR